MFDLSGMTALVTGASGGIGSAIVRGLAGQGARVAVSGSNADKLAAFREALGGDHVAVEANLSDAAAVDALVPRAAEALGIPVTGIDFLVPAVDGPDYVFIEANERPGLANHEPQPTAARFVDLLFPETRRR